MRFLILDNPPDMENLKGSILRIKEYLKNFLQRYRYRIVPKVINQGKDVEEAQSTV